MEIHRNADAYLMTELMKTLRLAAVLTIRENGLTAPLS